MKKYLRNIQDAFREVFSSKGYWALALFSAAILYSLNAVIQNRKLLTGNFSFSLLWALIKGLNATFTVSSYILLIAIVLLGGITITFSIFLLRRQIAMGASAGVGAIAAVVAPACPSCALGVLGSIGLGGAAGFFPLGGVEIALFALLLLIISMTYLSSKIVSPAVCRPKREQEGR